MSCTIRPLQGFDDASVAAIIRQVLTEFGANREGFAFVDAELEAMSRHYDSPRAQYFVLVRDFRVLGGGGFAPLAGGDEATAELKKMYFLPEVRGQGYGRELIEVLLKAAAAAGYSQIYLETTAAMGEAIRLYTRAGFHRRSSPLGQTGHFACEVWFDKSLIDLSH